jgi:hypothetical protein
VGAAQVRRLRGIEGLTMVLQLESSAFPIKWYILSQKEKGNGRRREKDTCYNSWGKLSWMSSELLKSQANVYIV